MTQAAAGLIEEGFKLDRLKDHLGSINELSHRIVFSDENFSLFPLFYVANKFFGDIYDMENQTIALSFKEHEQNGIKLMTTVSVLQNGDAWTDIFAFNAFVEASNNIEIDIGTVTPCSAAEISFALTNLAGIEGALALPIKHDVIAYIKASLDNDGWAIPPLILMFKSIEDEYSNDKFIADTKKHFGHLSIDDILSLDNFDGLDIDNRPDLQNYLARNQEVCLDFKEKCSKLMFDWTTAIRGE